MVNQTLKNSKQLSSSSYKDYSEELAKKILRSNGYSLPYHPHKLPRCTQKSDTSIPLIVPYINFPFCKAIIEAVNKSKLPIHVICKPPANLGKILMRSRLYDRYCQNPRKCPICPSGKVGDCLIKGCVYQMECQSCRAKYYIWEKLEGPCTCGSKNITDI